MKYNQPFGNSNEDAPYVNGNPETGQMGSIPPAASIEYPQREIVNLINVTGLAPTNSDLLQVAKAIQSGRINYGEDIGEPNKVSIIPVVPVSSYKPGLRLVIRMGYGNTSQVTINVSGLGPVPLIHSGDLSPLLAYELLAGQLIEVCYDGANFQMIGGGSSTATVTMTAPTHLYVSANTGDDTIYDGTSPVVSGQHGGPFRTIQKALQTMRKYNLGGWDFVIHVADGVYAEANSVVFPLPNGSGVVTLVGNQTNPNACQIFNIGTGTAWFAWTGGTYAWYGFSFRATAPQPGDGGHGIWIQNTTVIIGDCAFNAVPVNTGIHAISGPSSFLFIVGKIFINGPAMQHMCGYANGICYNTIPYEPDLTITAPVNFQGGFWSATCGGQARPTYGVINGAGNVTGPRYSATSNGVIDTGGRGANYLPGSQPGAVWSGGQYL